MSGATLFAHATNIKPGAKDHDEQAKNRDQHHERFKQSPTFFGPPLSRPQRSSAVFDLQYVTIIGKVRVRAFQEH